MLGLCCCVVLRCVVCCICSVVFVRFWFVLCGCRVGCCVFVMWFDLFACCMGVFGFVWVWLVLCCLGWIVLNVLVRVVVRVMVFMVGV